MGTHIKNPKIPENSNWIGDSVNFNHSDLDDEGEEYRRVDTLICRKEENWRRRGIRRRRNEALLMDVEKDIGMAQLREEETRLARIE
ncbi:unnamed protein product [Linum trigynum]|uniref:Uncharacterized protein n=1 Tax=Linum trigynum TaxID=586398 RepID=A0AAV2E5C8_9ROSI